MNQARAALTLLALALLGGCTQMVDLYGEFMGSTNPSDKPAPLPQFTPTATARVSWQASIGKGGGYVFFPALAVGQVYVASGDGDLARIDSATGKQVWRVKTGRKLSGGVGFGAGLVLVGTPKGEVIAYGEDGTERWSARVTSEVLAPPAGDEGVVVVRAGDGRIFGLDAANGKRKWVYQRATPALVVRSFAGVLVIKGAVFAGFPGGKLVALNLSNGVVGWEGTVARPKGTTELERIADVVSAPVTDLRQICAVAFQGSVTCFDPIRGKSIWTREISSSAGMGIDTLSAYVTDSNSVVHALDKDTGASVWKQDQLRARRVSAPASRSGFIAAGDLEGYVHIMGRGDGAFAARIATDGSPIAVPPLPLEDGFLVQTLSGGIFAIKVQ